MGPLFSACGLGVFQGWEGRWVGGTHRHVLSPPPSAGSAGEAEGLDGASPLSTVALVTCLGTEKDGVTHRKKIELG